MPVSVFFPPCFWFSISLLLHHPVLQLRMKTASSVSSWPHTHNMQGEAGLPIRHLKWCCTSNQSKTIWFGLKGATSFWCSPITMWEQNKPNTNRMWTEAVLWKRVNLAFFACFALCLNEVKTTLWMLVAGLIVHASLVNVNPKHLTNL